MKTKIVEHIVGHALHALSQADGEVDAMKHRYPDILADRHKAGPGLDFAVLREKLTEAIQLLELLT